MKDNKKFLTGNSGDVVYVDSGYVVKKAGLYPDKFEQQMNWLYECEHPNFIKIVPIDNNTYVMLKYPTWYSLILKQSIKTSLSQLNELLDIVDNFEGEACDVKTDVYLSKLSQRTGYTYTGKFDATSKWGFVHGDLTVGNCLYKEKMILIDPRGTYEQDYYDYGKLMQSFVMKYEMLLSGKHSNKYDNFCNAAKNLMYERYDRYQLDFFLAVHLLGAVPFLKDNNRLCLADLFLEKGHEIFKQLDIKYEITQNN